MTTSDRDDTIATLRQAAHKTDNTARAVGLICADIVDYIEMEYPEVDGMVKSAALKTAGQALEYAASARAMQISMLKVMDNINKGK